MTPYHTVLEILDQLVAFDTTSHKSNLELIDYIENHLTAWGGTCIRVPNEDGTKTNLFATIGPNVDGGVILSGHSDVVPTDDQPWVTDPFKLTKKGSKVFGRGTTDMKGFLAVCLAMAPEMASADLKRPIHIAVSYDEEVGCIGVRSLIARLENWPVRPVAVLVGEPTSMRVVDAHKGIVAYRVDITGREAHSSTRGLGLNAINVAARLINAIEQLGESFADGSNPDARRDVRFSVNHSTVSMGTITGGTAINIIAKNCSFLWECRPLPNDNPDLLLKPIFDLITTMRTDIQAKVPESDIIITKLVKTPGLLPEPGSIAESIAFKLAHQNHTEAVAFATEGGLFQSIGLPTVVCGPGHIDQAHTANEFIEIAQLESCETMIRNLITSLTEQVIS